MISIEDKKRIEDAQKCDGCLDWHKYCKAECCKTIFLKIDPKIIEESHSEYIIIKTSGLSPGDQYYYQLHDVRYTRGTLRFKRDRIHIFGNNVCYLHQCKLLDENNLCKGHPERKPSFCKYLTLATSENDDQRFVVTENCLFKYKLKGGSNDGK